MSRILVALDVDSAARAEALADGLRGHVAGFKIGKQLFTAEGPTIVRSLAERGDRVFLDLKFHDIPNTVAGAVASAVATGAWMVNVHASGGRKMMQAAIDAARASAANAARPRPLIIAVTVLTSLDAASFGDLGVPGTVMDHVVRLARLAQDSGLDGVVASPQEIAAIRAACGTDFLIVTPGIRPAGRAVEDDQARTMSAAEAVESGASYLVVGRPITGASDPIGAADRLNEEVAATRIEAPAP